MTFLEIAEAIYKYGGFIVLLAMLILAIFWFAKGFDKLKEEHNKAEEQHRKDMDEAAKRLTALTDVVTNITKTISTYPVHTKEQEVESRQFDAFLNKQLQELRDNTKASRAVYVAYHNGGASITGRPFARCSVIAERVDVKTNFIAPSYQNFQRALIGAVCDELDTDRHSFCGDVTLLHDNAAKAILTDWKAKSAYCCAVVDNINDIVVGFIVLQFNHILEQEDEGVLNEIQTVASAIAGAVQLNKRED